MPFEIMAAAPDALDDGQGGGGLLDEEEPDLSRPGTAQEMQGVHNRALGAAAMISTYQRW